MIHRGSIACNHLYFAALILFFVLSSHLEHIYICQLGKLREIVGDVEEEELEGEAVAGPRGEATAHTSVSTPPIPLIFLVIHLYVYIFFQHIITHL